jgi:GDPmannose 4,6-dehydratase
LSDLSDNVGKYKEVLQKTKLGMSQREMYRVTGISRVFIRKVQNGYIPSNTHHLELCHNEVKKIVEIPNYEGWFFDLETESGTFCAGVGQGVVHNSPRRGHEFVTRKISDGVARIHLGLQEKIMLGNLDSYRDWGYAPAYVECMWLMLQQDAPDDYVVATGETHSIREFLDHAFKCVGIDDWSKYVGQDPRYMRPAEVDVLRGDSSKAREKLGWESSTTFEELVSKMVKNDIKLLS